ncbi:MAG: DEAD/DEAH box helicase [Candidatus Omnitrophota bacterium]
MKIENICKKYNFPEEVTKILNRHGYVDFYPPQKEAVSRGLLDKKNFILSMPTASGKTLLAELCMLKTILKEGGKCIYVVPLKALASEKAEDFKDKYESLGIKTTSATGDYDVPSSYLANYDIIVATAEKVDSLLRFRARWLSQEISMAVFDEIHFIDDTHRGPTLEILITRLRQVNPNLKILGLSATIKNAKQIAKWLDAECILDDWRPVSLKEGVYYNSALYFSGGEKQSVHIPSASKELEWLASETVQQNGQVLVFVNTRRSTQSTAREIGNVLKLHLNQETKDKLTVLSEGIRSSMAEKTDLDLKLSETIKNGASFHHAGLRYSQRKLIEDAFKQNIIKVICATPTLAAGVNLPARRVIIRDHKRYEAGLGSHHIAVFEYKQMCGRAGRPKYDNHGESILMAKSRDEVESLFEEFINSEPEPIISKLGSESVLRMHLLAAIASDYVKDKNSILEFLSNTFFAVQQDAEDLEFIVERIIDFLNEEGMIEESKGILKASAFGNLICRLYIDPVTGVILRNGLVNAKYKKHLTITGLLHLICSTPNMAILKTAKSDYLDMENFNIIHKEDFLLPGESRYTSSSHMEYLNVIKTTKFLENWCSEESEEKLCKQFGVGPGDLRRYTEISDWLLYAAHQTARLFNIMDAVYSLDKLKIRLKYGIKEELLDLVGLKGIGRIRARTLYSKGLKKIADIKKASVPELARIKNIGQKIAESIKKQVSEKE